MTEKRIRGARIERIGSASGRGGGSAERPRHCPGGGGSPGSCSAPGFSLRAPTLGDLVASGVPAHWVAVAKAVGVEAMLEVWRVLDGSDTVADMGRRVWVPYFSRWLRHQRRRLILDLTEAGHDRAEVRREVLRITGEPVSARYVSRLVRRHGLGGAVDAG